MCGIVGSVTKRQWGFDNFDLDWFKQMLVCDTIRGVDGTGMFVAGRNKHVLWGKVATHPFRLFQFQETGQMFAFALGQGRVVVGHNRKATSGLVKNENAHPFVKDHITLVHNGIVRNAREFVETDVDSEVIAHVLASEDDVPKALGRLEGDFAIVWHDSKKNKLFLARNDARPLWLGESQNGFYFASEPWMLAGIYDRVFPQKEPLNECRPLKPNTVTEIDLSTLKATTYGAEFAAKKPTPSLIGGTGSRHHPPVQKPAQDGSSVTVVIPTLGQAPLMGRATWDIGAVITSDTLTLEKRSWDSGGGKIVDRYYLSGRERISGVTTRVWLPIDVDHKFIDDLIEAKHFTAKVKHPIWKGATLLAYWVENPKVPLPEQMVRTYNGGIFGMDRWKQICSDHKCLCGKGINAKWPKYTSVQFKGGDTPRIICPECLTTKFQTWSPATQAQITHNNGYSPMDYILESKLESGEIAC